MAKRSGVLLAALFLLSVVAAPGRLVARADKKQDYSAEEIARGKYLVEDVAMCGTCHTPVDEKGELDRTKWLQGTKLSFAPIKPNPDWHPTTPRIAGLPPGKDWTPAVAIRLLETGISHDGKPPDQPMPQFRMSPQDAKAVVAYLMSLAPAK